MTQAKESCTVPQNKAELHNGVLLCNRGYTEVFRVVGKGGNHEASQQGDLHGLLQAKPSTCQRTPDNGGNGQHPKKLHGSGGLFAL